MENPTKEITMTEDYDQRTARGALLAQIEGHWDDIARPRLEGLTDEEYFFDPTPESAGPAWSVHARSEQRAAMQGGGGDLVIDFELPEPTPPPFTTIAWRLGHVIVGVLAMRSHGHFDGPEVDYFSWDYAPTASEALTQLDTEYERWISGLRSWSAEDFLEPCGPAEGPYADYPRTTIAAHINRELIHHLAEIALLRDLYAHRG
jgi:hypothetical protein